MMNEGGGQAHPVNLAASPALSSAPIQPPRSAFPSGDVARTADTSKQTTSPQSVTRNTKARKPPAKSHAVTRNNGAVSTPKKAKEKPLKVAGYHWRSNGSGWELRRTITIDGKRSQPYVAHLSRTAYQEMRRAHRGEKLAAALSAWVAEREGEKP